MILFKKSTLILRTFGFAVFFAAFIGCSGGGNSDNPAPEGDLSPSAPSSLSLSGLPTLSSSPSLTWAESTPQTGSIASYWLAIGTTEGGEEFMTFTNIGNVLTYQLTGSELTLGSNYYFTIYSTDDGGRNSAPMSSEVWIPQILSTDGAYHEPEAPYFLSSCAEYLVSPYIDGQGDGIYWIDPDGVGGVDEIKAYCDQTTDGGGWQLVLNYFHQGGTDPARTLFTTSLPMRGTSVFGDDGSADAIAWGHSSTDVVNSLNPGEARFYCTSDLHGKVVHFKTSHGNSLNYMTSGAGRMLGLASSFTPMAGHSSNLPGSATAFGNSYGDDSLIRFPFMLSGSEHWSVGFGSRWECDDFAFNSANNTVHQVWVR